MKEIEHNEQRIDNPTQKETPESIKEAQDKKAQFGNSLDSFSSAGAAKRQEGNVAKTETADNKTDAEKFSETKPKSETADEKKQALGAKLDKLTAAGTPKEAKDVCATKIDDKVTDIEKEKLPAFLADTFKDGKYRTVIANEDIKLYRTYGGTGKAELKGAFATTEPTNGIEETRQKCAILPEWNDCTKEAEITVPKGTILNIGKTEQKEDQSDGTIYEGGGDQVLLPQNWHKEHPEWVTNIRDIKEDNND